MFRVVFMSHDSSRESRVTCHASFFRDITHCGFFVYIPRVVLN